MNKKSPVRFHFPTPYSLQNRRLLKNFIEGIFKKEKVRLQEIDIIFCDDQYLLNLNITFLNHDYFTDTLSFPLSRPKEPLIAEIYISVDRVKENAHKENVSVKKELHRVIFHGILHFCGYKDKTNRDSLIMRKTEDKYLKAYLG